MKGTLQKYEKTFLQKMAMLQISNPSSTTEATEMIEKRMTLDEARNTLRAILDWGIAVEPWGSMDQLRERLKSALQAQITPAQLFDAYLEGNNYDDALEKLEKIRSSGNTSRVEEQIGDSGEDADELSDDETIEMFENAEKVKDLIKFLDECTYADGTASVVNNLSDQGYDIIEFSSQKANLTALKDLSKDTDEEDLFFDLKEAILEEIDVYDEED